MRTFMSGMSEGIKKGFIIGLIVVLSIFIYQKFFPTIKTKTVTKYQKGKTDTLVITKDSLVYLTKIKLITDTFYVDTAGEHASAFFNLQDSIVTGVVKYNTPAFSFYNVKVRQKIINNYIIRIDTIKTTITNTIKNKFHLGIISGYGVGLQDQKPQFFIGLGASWEIF